MWPNFAKLVICSSYPSVGRKKEEKPNKTFLPSSNDEAGCTYYHTQIATSSQLIKAVVFGAGQVQARVSEFTGILRGVLDLCSNHAYPV